MEKSVCLEPQILLTAYAQGVFPMADEDGLIRWYTADPRGILPLEAFHVPKTLGQLIRQRRFEIRINHAFDAVMRGCMKARPSSWINAQIIRAYTRLHELGFAHSVEAWQEGKLAGGLYGVSLGAAFFGESMFHTVRDASKVALFHLVERLRERGFELLDTQATTEHLCRFGAINIPADRYMLLLRQAIAKPRDFA
jgi:leucyl/phenylalanyl-tRNA---protein transferase